MKRIVAALAVGAGMLSPLSAFACTGPAGQFVAISYDGNKYTVVNMGKRPVHVVFTAYIGQTYVLDLYPGQASTPASSGWLQLPMKGYQTCVAS